MPTITPAVSPGQDPPKDSQLVAWTPLANGDNGARYELHNFIDVTVQVFGTFGAGGSVQMEGSNDGGTNWAIIGSAITAAGLVRLAAAPKHIRPNVTNGDGSTALTVLAFARRARVG